MALLSDTGMRLSEAVGLVKSDIHINDQTPYIQLKPTLAEVENDWQREGCAACSFLGVVQRASAKTSTDFFSAILLISKKLTMPVMP